MKRLLTKTQQLLLQLFYTNPEQSFYMHELGKIIGKKPGVFQRTLNGLVEEGLLLSEYRGRARFFQTNVKHPLYPELKKIIAKTVGVEGSLREIFSRVKEVKLALLYGSFVKGKERADSDIDLLIVGRPDLEDRLIKEMTRLERKLQREINYKLYSEPEYREKQKKGDPFLEEILSDQIIILKGNPHAL